MIFIYRSFDYEEFQINDILLSSLFQELRKEMEMMNYDPYGKPGAGAPNTNRNKKTSHFPPINNESNSRNNSSKINRFRREETFEFYDPWGKG